VVQIRRTSSKAFGFGLFKRDSLTGIIVMKAGRTTSRLNRDITRRDFVNGVAVGVGSALLTQTAPGCTGQDAARGRPSLGPDWYGYGGVGDYRLSHGNTPEVVATAHRIRDGEFEKLPREFASVEEYDLVIVGGGVAGLGAALEFSKKRKPGQTCLLLDNHPIFGGEAKENEFKAPRARTDSSSQQWSPIPKRPAVMPVTMRSSRSRESSPIVGGRIMRSHSGSVTTITAI
jgi:hypothetical protein